MTLRIHGAHGGDLPTIIALLSAARLSSNTVCLQSGRYWIAVNCTENPIGLVGVEAEGNACLLRSLVIAPPYRHRGYGTQLVLHAINEVSRTGCAHMYAFSTGAGGFFTRCGFESVPVQRAAAALPSIPQVIGYRNTGELMREQAWYICLDRSDPRRASSDRCPNFGRSTQGER